jgi:hydroxypyruvate isomerase
LFFSVCTELIYPRVRVERRTAKVAAHGFDRIDIWDWKSKDLAELKKGLKASGVALNSAVAHTRSSTSVAADRKKFLAELRGSLEFARKFDCDKLIVLSEYLTGPNPGAVPPVMPAALNPEPGNVRVRNMVDALNEGCDIAEASGVVLLLEALNNYDHPSYYLNSSSRALDVVRKVRRRNLKMLYDIYHMQVSEGNVTETLTRNLDAIGCLHFADVPGRHEPGTGELNLPFILGRLSSAAYSGGMVFEYSPAHTDDSALERVREVVGPYL